MLLWFWGGVGLALGGVQSRLKESAVEVREGLLGFILEDRRSFRGQLEDRFALVRGKVRI